jgi:Na+/H+ antiporter NhaD/arsenite permease-like protein
MAFLSVILCNVRPPLLPLPLPLPADIHHSQFAGTNIGTTILLCRVVQAWVAIHDRRGTAITQRTFWATVYSMAIGVNYGAFSTAFSASLAGLLWRDILARKNIHVRSRDFAWVNLPIM